MNPIWLHHKTMALKGVTFILGFAPSQKLKGPDDKAAQKLHWKNDWMLFFKPKQFLKTWPLHPVPDITASMKALAFSSLTCRFRKNFLGHFEGCWPIHSTGPQPSSHLVLLTLDDLWSEISKLPFRKLFTMNRHYIWGLRHLTLVFAASTHAWKDCCEF